MQVELESYPPVVLGVCARKNDKETMILRCSPFW
uniref:Uncharacterized protein n=1 Tax=Populus trichocarpa TaxID=3694 RepID=A0A3N7G8L2_POPTR